MLIFLYGLVVLSFQQENLLQDISAVRELCRKLDQTRESLSRQLATKNLDQDQVGLKAQTHDATFLATLRATRVFWGVTRCSVELDPTSATVARCKRSRTFTRTVYKTCLMRKVN